MATPPSTPSRRLTRSQTATTVLGKRSSLSRSSSVVSNKSVAMLTPESTRVSKRVRTSMDIDDSRANKENIPPMRDFVLQSPSASRLSRRSSFSSDISTASTRSRNNLHRSATHAAIPQTPSTTLNTLSLVTPPATPAFTIPLYLRVRGLLRATSNSDHGMSMDGRETECAVIESFLHSLDGDSDSAESVLYVSGSPGTGKTALVNSIISSTKAADDVKVLFMNCMAISGMDALWQKLAEELEVASGKGKTGRQGKKFQGKDKVCAILEKSRGLKCILVLDELDNLAASSSNALQPLFALAASYSSTLRIMGVANTHTLTSTSSIPISASASTPAISGAKNVKIKTIHFAPYNSSELLAILKKRFENLPQDELMKLLPMPALTLLTKKVSSLTGDVRALFEVLRGAIDVAVSSASSLPSSGVSSPPSPPSGAVPKVIVSPAHILSALKSYTPSSSPSKSKHNASDAIASGNSEIVTKVRSLGLQQRLVLLALVLASKRSAATLPLSSHSSSSSIKTLASPTKRPRSPLKRSGSSNVTAFGASEGTSTTGTDSSQLFSYYTSLLATADTLTAVSRSEFTDLLSMLETTGLIALATPSTRSFKRSSSFTGSMKSGSANGSQSVALQTHVREGEVVRGLGIIAAVTGDGDALLDEVRMIWSREMARIRREAKAKDALAVLEGIEGFEDSIMD